MSLGLQHSDIFCAEYATWQVMEEYLPNEVYQQYRTIFNSLDDEGRGVVDIECVAVVVSKYGRHYTAEELKSILGKIISCGQCYSTNDCYVDFAEFLAVMSSISTNCIPEDEILKVFNIFDQDGDGFIGREELRNLLSKLGDEVSEKEVEEMIKEADRDGDGLVSYHEFVRMLTNSVENCLHEPRVTFEQKPRRSVKKEKQAVHYEHISETLRRNMSLFSDGFLQEQDARRRRRRNSVDGNRKKVPRRKRLRRAVSSITSKAANKLRNNTEFKIPEDDTKEVEVIESKTTTRGQRVLNAFQSFSTNMKEKSRTIFNFKRIS